MNVVYKIHDTTGHLDKIIETLNGGVHKVAKRVAGEMERKAKRALKTDQRTSPKRIREGHLRASIHNRVWPAGPLAFRAVAGTNVHYAAYVEYGTGPRGARDAAYYGPRYGWPRIKYSLPRIRPRVKRALSWQPKKGTAVATMIAVRGGKVRATGQLQRRKGKTFAVARVAVKSTMGMHAHPFLTPQPFAVKPTADKMLVETLQNAWNGGRR